MILRPLTSTLFPYTTLFRSRSRSRSSSGVSNENTVSMPARRQFAISSSSQSPPRGREATASLPCQGPLTQWSFVHMLQIRLHNDLARKCININAPSHGEHGCDDVRRVSFHRVWFSNYAFALE